MRPHHASVRTHAPRPPRSLRKTILSRAYLNFAEPATVYEFKARFDGHAFITTKGSQYKCTVEYAPFQKVPSPPKKKNPLEGTIDQGEGGLGPHAQQHAAQGGASPHHARQRRRDARTHARAPSPQTRTTRPF